MHKFAGIKTGEGTEKEIIETVLSNKRSVGWWKTAKVLIVDEVSMISKELFELLDWVAKVVRKNKKPFGGIQLVLCGDMHQLPSVSKGKKETTFCFESDSWKENIKKVIFLKEIFRQSQTDFIQLLNEIRVGKCSQKTEQILNSRVIQNLNETNEQYLKKTIFITEKLTKNCSEKLIADELVYPSILYTHNRDVDQMNEKMLKQIKRKGRIYQCEDTEKDGFVGTLNNVPAVSKLKLKPGSQVVLLKNIDPSSGLCNGSRGVVLGFGTIFFYFFYFIFFFTFYFFYNF